jgi:tetraacyldisaccharide 4'-kinase
MDDGHQNPSLFKDLSLVVIDAAAPFGNGFVIPKGPLREPVNTGLARADAVILMGDGPEPEAVTASNLPVLRANLKPLAPPPKGPLIAFAGIGRPEKFFDGLRKAGGEIIEDVGFGDHHTYSSSDMTYLRRLAEERGAQLITTAKDHARLSPEDREEIEVFNVEAVFDDTAALDALLAPVLDIAAS